MIIYVIVQALHVNLGTLYNISPLTQLPLRHLQLEMSQCVPLGGLKMLGCMALLETLVIHCTIGSLWFGGHPDVGDPFPKLDLRGCTHLFAVAFKMSIPLQVQVPEKCSVHLESGCELLTNVSSTLKACNSCTCFVNRNSRLCQFLGNRFAALTSLQISGNFDPHGQDDDDSDNDDDSDSDNDGAFEPLSVILGSNVRHLKFLNIRSSRSRRGVFLDIAASLQLVSLQVLAEGHLSVSISHPGTLAAALQVFHLQGSNELDKSTWLKPLLRELRGVGKGYGTYHTTPQKNRGLPYRGVRWMAGIGQCRGQAIRGHFGACRCGACWGCLKKAGALDRLLRN